MNKFHVSATGHSLNYLPHYAAVSRGYFADEGMEVSVSVPSPWDQVLDDIAEGSAFAALGGIWVPAMHHKRGMRLVPFAQLSGRAPLALIGRTPDPDFDLSRLAGRVVAMKGSNGASVGMFLKMSMRERGLDPRAVDYIQDLDGKLLSRCYAGGMADYLLIDLPNALAFEAAGHGHVVAKFAESGGDIPWSVYYTWGDWPAERPDPRPAFVRALGRAMDWINEAPMADIAPLLSSEFPSIDPGIASGVVALYRARGMWRSPTIDVDGYNRWQTGIADAHLTTAPIPYEALVDVSPTTARTA